MKLFLFLLRVNAWKILVAVVICVVSGVANAGLIALVTHVWKQGEFSSPVWIWRFAGVLAVVIASGLAAQLMVLHLALKAIADLRLELSAKILATPLRDLEELGAPRLMAVLTDDVNAVSRVLPNIPRVVIDMTTLVAGVAYLAWLSWTAMAALLAFAVTGIVVYRLLWLRSLRFMKSGRDVFDTLFDHFRALHDGLKQLKLNRSRRRSFLADDVHDALESYRAQNMSGRALLVVAENLTRLVFFVFLGLLVFVVPRMEGIEAGILMSYVAMSLYLYRPLGSLMAVVPEFGRARVSLQKVDDLGLSLEAQDAKEDDGAAAKSTGAPQPGWKELELAGVTYAYRREYDDRAFTVGPIDLVFHPGELVFVLGGNGSGKTTLAKILTSLYEPDRGEIRLDGEPISDANRERYRQLFAAVFSDYHLFHNLVGTGQSDLDERATEHLRELQLEQKVEVKDGRLSTTALSTGQRKRLALLAAYLEDRPFYVFDEWAADQDPQFKNIFYTRILRELKARGKTVLVITHDDRYVYVADRCLKLEDGKVQQVDALEPAGGAGAAPLGSGRPGVSSS